jgi:hypothetical protein
LRRGNKATAGLGVLARQPGDAAHAHPFLFQRFGFLFAGFAVDRPLVGFAVVDLARLFGKLRADVVEALFDLAAQLLRTLADCSVSRMALVVAPPTGALETAVRAAGVPASLPAEVPVELGISSLRESLCPADFVTCGAIIAFSTFLDPQTGHSTTPASA